MKHLQFGKVYFYRAFYWYFCEVHGTKGSFRSIFYTPVVILKWVITSVNDSEERQFVPDNIPC